MLRIVNGTILSKALRVLLSCTVFVMFNAMMRIYQDPEGPHDMYPGIETCRHIKDLARYKYDGEYLIRSDMVAQLSLLWSQSDCSRYAALLSNPSNSAETRTSQVTVNESNQGLDNSDVRQASHEGPALNSAKPLEDFIGSVAHTPALVGGLSIVSTGDIMSVPAQRGPVFSSRSDDVPSPPPRALS